MFFRRKSKDSVPAMPVVAPPPRVAIPAVAPGEPDMRGLGRALWAKKTKIIGFTLLVTALAFVVVNMITPRYRSETRILLEAKENVFLRAEADKVADRTVVDPELVTSQTQVILSRDLAREVIRKEGLKENPEFNSSGGILKTLMGLVGLGRDPSDMSAEERTLEAFYARLNVFAVDKSRVISVSFSSADPDVRRQCRQHDRCHLSDDCSKPPSSSRRAMRASGWPAKLPTLRQKVSEAESERRAISHAKQSLWRRQQHVAADPAAHRDQFADRDGARPESRPRNAARGNCAKCCAPAARSMLRMSRIRKRYAGSPSSA